MRVILSLFLLLAVATIPLQGCSSSKEMSAASASACEMCAKGKAGESVWCDGCEAGYVDSAKVSCASCYAGKTGNDTWCEGCNAGYVNAEKVACKGCYTAQTTGTACTSCEG